MSRTRLSVGAFEVGADILRADLPYCSVDAHRELDDFHDRFDFAEQAGAGLFGLSQKRLVDEEAVVERLGRARRTGYAVVASVFAKRLAERRVLPGRRACTRYS